MAERPGRIKLAAAGNLTDKVADALRKQITQNVHRPGEALLSEQKIAALFGVSRTVTREAIARLKAEGLVTVKQGVGVFVSSEIAYRPFRIDSSISDSVDSILDIIELRSAIEIKASELAAIRRKRSHLVEMNDALKKIDDANKAGDVEKYVRADFEFHAAIYSATGNPYYSDFFMFISQYFMRVVQHNRMYGGDGDVHGQAQREHYEIFEAIVAQNVDQTIASAKQHLDGVTRRIHRAEFNLETNGPALSSRVPKGGDRIGPA